MKPVPLQTYLEYGHLDTQHPDDHYDIVRKLDSAKGKVHQNANTNPTLNKSISIPYSCRTAFPIYVLVTLTM